MPETSSGRSQATMRRIPKALQGMNKASPSKVANEFARKSDKSTLSPTKKLKELASQLSAPLAKDFAGQLVAFAHGGSSRNLGLARTKSSKNVTNNSISSPTKPTIRKTNNTKVRPKEQLDKILIAKGYSTETHPSLESGYYNKATALQQASYGVRLVEAVRDGDAKLLRDLLSAGLSPNPCNKQGESLLHMVCRRGDPRMLRVMLEHGCDVRYSDENGRTPLHDAFWSEEPSFEIVELILELDVRQISMCDSRGLTPLSYARSEKWDEWNYFLFANRDRFWPRRNVRLQGSQGPPELALMLPNSRQAADPENCLTVEIASMLAMGRMEPSEATVLGYDIIEQRSGHGSVIEVDLLESDRDNDDLDAWSTDSGSVFSFDEEEVADILNNFALATKDGE